MVRIFRRYSTSGLKERSWARDKWSAGGGAVYGAFSVLVEVPESCLAAIICLDQFPRNIYRETGRSFQSDALALELTEQGLQKGFDRSLSPLERAFFFMPLMHDESLASQERCVSLLSDLIFETEGPLKQYLEGSLDFAGKHRDIIVRFGCYPHRNLMPGRDITSEELDFLKEPGSSF